MNKPFARISGSGHIGLFNDEEISGWHETSSNVERLNTSVEEYVAELVKAERDRIILILKRHRDEVMKLQPEYCHELICALQEVEHPEMVRDKR